MKINPVVGFLIVVAFGVGLSYHLSDSLSHKTEQPKIKPCNCLTYSEWQLLSTKRDIVVERLNYSKKANKAALKDSLKKYNELLGIDETQDNYPEK